MQGSIYEDADEHEMKDPIARDPRLDEKDREGRFVKYKVKFLTAFSGAPDKKQGKKGFFKVRLEILSAEGDNPYPVGTIVSLPIFPRDLPIFSPPSARPRRTSSRPPAPSSPTCAPAAMPPSSN